MVGTWIQWWRRPCGLHQMLVLSLPLVISTASWTLMQFTDRVFLLWHSADAVAAALPAGMLSFTVVCFPLGVVSYVNTFVAQYFGAQRHHRIGLVVWQGIWIALAAMPLVLATAPMAPALFAAAGHAPQIARLEVVAYQTLCWGSGGMLLSAAISAFFTGRGKVRTVMVVDSFGAGLNIVLDYAWIFGHWGFPEMGIVGASLATVVATWTRAAIYVALWLRPTYHETYQTLAGCRLDRELLGRLLWFGAPNGLQIFFEAGGFAAYLLVIGKLGPLALAASSLAFNVNSLAFMPVYGIGIATATMVGQRLGENRPDLAGRATWSAFVLAALLMLPVAALYVLAPDWLLAAHRVNVDAVEFDELREVTVVLLRFVAFYCLFDAMNIVFSSAVKGAGDTRYVLVVTLILSAAAVLVTWLGIEEAGLGLYWSWVAVTGWVCLLGVAFMLRFLGGQWRQMRVIEEQSPREGSGFGVLGSEFEPVAAGLASPAVESGMVAP